MIIKIVMQGARNTKFGNTRNVKIEKKIKKLCLIYLQVMIIKKN